MSAAILFACTWLPPLAHAQKKAPATSRAGTPLSAAQFDTLAREAELARTSGDAPKAQSLYQTLLKARPGWAEGWFYLAMIHYDANRFAEAIPPLQHVVSLEPKVGSGWTYLGLCEYETGKYTEALEHLEKANKLGSGDAATARVANYHRALLLNLNGRFQEATSLLSAQFGQEKLNSQIAIAMGLALLRRPILPEQLDVTKQELVFASGQASAAMEHEQYADALQLLQNIEKEHPEEPYVHYSAAKALGELGRWEEARLQLADELKLSPRDGNVYTLLSTASLKTGDIDAALSNARAAVALATRSPEAHHALSEALRAKGDATAEKELEVARALGWRGSSQSNDQPRDTTGSANATTNSEVAALQQKAQAAAKSGDMPRAIAAYRDALQLQPNWAEGLLFLATVAYTQGTCADALPLANRLTQVEPNVGASWGLLGLCEFQTGDYENSFVHLMRGRDIGFPPGGGGAVSEANYHIGLLLNRKGDFGTAHDLLLQEVKSATHRAEDAKYALGINLLRLRLLPSQVTDADKPLVTRAGEIAIDLSRSDYGPATSKFDELLKAYPGRSYIHDAYGWALMSISRYDAAAQQYREEIRLSPNAAEGYLGLANAGLKIHNFEEARDAAKKAVQIAPDSAMAHGHYGRALVELGEVPQGVTELEKAVKLAIQIPELHYALSRAYAKANRPKDAERERQIFLRLNKSEAQ